MMLQIAKSFALVLSCRAKGGAWNDQTSRRLLAAQGVDLYHWKDQPTSKKCPEVW